MSLASKIRNGVSNYLFGTHILNLIGSREKIAREYYVDPKSKPALEELFEAIDMEKRECVNYFRMVNALHLFPLGASIFFEQPLYLFISLIPEAMRIKNLLKYRVMEKAHLDKVWQTTLELEAERNEGEEWKEGHYR